MLSQDELKTLLEYCPETGIFYRKVKTTNSINAGDVAGCINSIGYRTISLNNRSYLAHRLVWLYAFGYFPKFIDHINGDRGDNRLANLREASRSENNRNCGMRSNNSSGYKGVSFVSRCNKWRAFINIDNKQIHLGYFNSAVLANEAYKSASLKYFGDFIRK
jgi:hypothetical protein